MKHVIIGASAAGLSAAKTIREISAPNDSITVLTSDTAVHSRCMLHHFLAKEKSVAGINFTEENFFSANRIVFMPESTVTGIDTASNIVKVQGGGEIPYDKLLVATGAQYFVPPINHFREAKNVFGFRDLIDAQKLDAVAAAGKKCVIVGSGLVGMDAAYALTARGVSCTIVELADRICPLQLDQTAATPYQQLFEKAGCTFYLSDGVEDAEVDEKGNICGIRIKSGATLPCDFVMVAAGVRPNTAILQDTGIQMDRTVVVDECLKTSADNVWAAGDITGIAGIWACAVKQGEVAGKNMCGQQTPYEDRFGFKNTMNFYGLTTLSLGVDNGEGEVVARESSSQYEKYVIKDNVLTYALIQGDISNTGFLQELIKRKVSLAGINKPVHQLTYADFYQYDKEQGKFKW